MVRPLPSPAERVSPRPGRPAQRDAHPAGGPARAGHQTEPPWPVGRRHQDAKTRLCHGGVV